MSYYVTYAGETSEDHGLLVYQRPNIIASGENITKYEIPGREWNFEERTGNFNSVSIRVVFNYATTKDKWAALYREAILWLRKSGTLSFSDDKDAFYRVLYVVIGEDERMLRKIGKFTATFVCEPGAYLTAGSKYILAEDMADTTVHDIKNELYRYTINNNWSECRPQWRIVGNGSCDISINGIVLNAIIENSLTIDTELKIAYSTNDAKEANTALTGDYNDAMLEQGENIVIIPDRFTLYVKANYRVL